MGQSNSTAWLLVHALFNMAKLNLRRSKFPAIRPHSLYPRNDLVQRKLMSVLQWEGKAFELRTVSQATRQGIARLV